MARESLLIAWLSLVGCSPVGQHERPPDVIAIHAQRVDLVSGIGPTAYFSIKNNGQRAQCFASDLIRSDETGAIFVRVKINGREVENRNAGYPPEPIPGELSVEPGNQVVVGVRLDKKLAIDAAAFASAKKLLLKATLEYWECGTQTAKRATSSWDDVPLRR